MDGTKAIKRYRHLSALLPVAVLAAALSLTPSASATAKAPFNPRPRAGIFGVVPAGHSGLPAPVSQLATTTTTTTGNLSYHNGPVLHANTPYAIYWLPGGSSVSAGYQSLINGFFANVASASGSTSNVYSTDVQYYDTSGSIAYSSSFGGSYVDSTTPLPNDCSSSYAGTGVSPTACLTDADVQAEVQRVLSATGWVPGPGREFFVFTPANVGSCFSAGSTQCAYTYYCAYHSHFADSQAGNADTLYANQPYPDSAAIGAPGACDSLQHPNGDWADAAINLVSHEHNESITDPDGNAWYDSYGNENGDKCAWNFGAALGSTAYGQYNQAIGSGRYYLQQEWSNASASCVLGYAPAVKISAFTPSTAKANTSVTISGSGFKNVSAVRFNGVSASYKVVSATSITATVPTSATSGPLTVVTSAGTGVSVTSFLILPTITSFSPTSGKAGTSVTLSGYNFTGATSVRFNGVAAPFAVSSALKIVTTVPSGATTGLISVTTAGGTGSAAKAFTVTG